MYEDYLLYQKSFKDHLDWEMQSKSARHCVVETFTEYIQRCIDSGELNWIEE